MKSCVVCGKSFDSKSVSVKYCSKVCAKRAEYLRYKPKRTANKEIKKVKEVKIRKKTVPVIPISIKRPTSTGFWMKPATNSAQSHYVIRQGEKIFITACHVSLNRKLAVDASIATSRCFECVEKYGKTGDKKTEPYEFIRLRKD